MNACRIRWAVPKPASSAISARVRVPSVMLAFGELYSQLLDRLCRRDPGLLLERSREISRADGPHVRPVP